MNISKILKDIRHMKIILKNLLLSPKLKFEVQNSYENVIDFDLSSNDYDMRDNSSKQLFNQLMFQDEDKKKNQMIIRK